MAEARNPPVEAAAEVARLQRACDVLEADNKHLQTKLWYANSAIRTFTQQIVDWDHLIDAAQPLILWALKQHDPEAVAAARHFRASSRSGTTSTTWIGGTWLTSPSDQPLLHETEDAFAHGKNQSALNLLSTICNRQDLRLDERINAMLLEAVIIRSAGQVRKAGEICDEAYQLALEYGSGALTGKAQFHRGLCHLHLDEYAKASWCFTLAANTPGHAEQVEANKRIAEENRLELSANDAKRYLSESC